MLKMAVASVAMGCLMVACSEQPKAEDVAGQTAKTYFEMLLRGEYDMYVDGTYRPDSIPDGYRKQLVANAKMYVGQLKEQHQGVKQVKVMSSRIDTAKHVGNVYLLLAFGDSTREEIVIPMVYQNGVWYMR